MYTLSLAFLFGTLSLYFFRDLPPLSLMLFGVVLIPALWIYWNHLFIRAVSTVLIAFLYTLYIAHSVNDAQLLSEYEGQTVRVIGTITQIPENKKGSTHFYFNVEQAQRVGQPNSVIHYHGKTKLAWYRHAPKQIVSGEKWQLDVRLKRPSGFMNTGGFDYEKWLFREGILATGYVRKSMHNQRLAKASSWHLDTLRESIHKKIQVNAPNEKAAAIISALSVAVKNTITTDQWEIFRKTGTSHLVAISGLHIGMIAGFSLLPMSLLWMLFPSLYLRMPIKKSALLLGAAFAILYALLAGFTVPTQRALVMVLFGLLSLYLKQKIPLSNILVTALLVVLLIDPLASLSEGFWLSFFSVSLIFYLLGQSHKKLRYKLIQMQLLLSFGMIPITAVFFGSASLVSPIANLVAIPLVTLVIAPTILLAIPLLFIDPNVASYLLTLASWGIDLLFEFLTYLSNLPSSDMQFTELPTALFVAAITGILVISLPRGLPGRWLGLLLVAPLFLYTPERLKLGQFKLSVLDVGQGLSAVIQTKNHVLLFDVGDRYSESFDIGTIVVLPYLQSQNIHQIDTLVISHLDKDHSGGAAAVMDKLPVIQLISNDGYSVAGRHASLCKAGQEWVWDDVTFRFLSPSVAHINLSENNRSCVLKISNKRKSLLLLADIEKETESWLLKNESLRLSSDVLLIPHHGSKTSSTSAFIRAVSPKIAIVSAGYRNRFRLPSQKIMDRYQRLGIPVLSTLEQGEIQMIFTEDQQKIEVFSKRQDDSHFWNRR